MENLKNERSKVWLELEKEAKEKLEINQKDIYNLKFIRNRMASVHGEELQTDYMQNFINTIEKLEMNQPLPLKHRENPRVEEKEGPILKRSEASEYFKDLFRQLREDTECPLDNSDLDDLQHYLFNRIIPVIPE